MQFTETSQQILNAFWLRPYSALIRILEANLLSLEDTKGATLELACGDGIFSALAKGANFPTDFSVYEDISNFSNISIKDDKDIFDIQPNAEAQIYRLEEPLWSYGLDHKKNLLAKANSFNIFKDYIHLSFDDPAFKRKILDVISFESLDLVYSNSLYWAKNPENILRAIKPLMKSDGILKFTIVSPNFYDNMIYNSCTHQKFANFLDRGRHSHYATMKSVDSWKEIFENSGFYIKNCVPYFSKELAQCVEWLDQREIYPFVSELYYSCNNEVRTKVKSSYLDHYKGLLTAFLEDYQMPNIENSCYYLFECIPQESGVRR